MNQSSSPAPDSRDDGALGLVGEDLPLHALERVVDRLAVAAERLGHLLVRVSVEVETERLRLEPRQRRAEAADERLQLLRRDHADRGIVDRRAGERVAERALALDVLSGR